MSLNKSAKKIRDTARLTYQQALRVADNQAALRIYDYTGCASLDWPFCASDTRLVSPGADDDWEIVYDCLCAACIEAHEVRA